MSFAIITDSTSDMSRDLRERHRIDYVTMNYVIGGKEYPATLDWEHHSPKEYYDLMRSGERVTTTQVPREIYENKFTACLEAGQDVVYISCSSALSGSVNLATVIAAELAEKYPECKVYCVDSLISSLGQASLVLMAAALRDADKTAAETAEYLIANRLKINQCGTVESLEYLRRAGRVKASKAFFGNLFGVKPIIISDKIGQNYAIKKAKGARNAKIAIADHLAENVVDPENQTLYISHADTAQDAEELKAIILEKIPFKEVYIDYIRPIVGASVGPGTIISFCFGKEVTVQGE